MQTYQIDTLIDTAPCGFLAFNDNGTILLANLTLLELLGYQMNGLQGRKIEVILPIASKIFYQTHFFPLLKLSGKAEEIYFSLRASSGEHIPMLINAVRRFKTGDFINECILIPIQKRIQYEEEILQAKKAAEKAIQAQKQAEKALRQEYEKSVLLMQMNQRICQSLDLAKIFSIASEEIRQFINAERVGIFKFHREGSFNSGEFVSESVAEGFNSVMSIRIEDHCFGEKHARYYQQGKIQVVEDINKAGFQDCHRDLLARFEIKTNLVAPLLKGEDLWGLLCVHQCSNYRVWQEVEIDLIKQIADQLAIAIIQADMIGQLQNELAHRRKIENRLKESNQQLAFSNEELAHATSILKRLVNTDGLTQIANRRCFDDRLEQEWARLYRSRQPLSLLLFDVDYFKRYNDLYGHQMGDECLRQIAQAVQKMVYRSPDLVARYGGEEFVVIVPDTDSQGALTIAQRIHNAIKDLSVPHQGSKVSDLVTVSIGLAVGIPSSEYSPAVLISQADQALYLAKQRGRNQSVLFSLEQSLQE